MREAMLLFGCVLLGCGSTMRAPPLAVTSAVTTHAPLPPQRATGLYARARAFELNGQCTEASSAYEQYADAVRPFDRQSADLALSYASLCPRRARVDAVLSSAISAIVAHDDARALALLDGAASDNPWVQYNRGVALADLHRTDEAAKAFDAAKVPIALYGKARAYHDALRCGEAWAAYREYAAHAEPADRELARAYARDCVKYTW